MNKNTVLVLDYECRVEVRIEFKNITNNHT